MSILAAVQSVLLAVTRSSHPASQVIVEKWPSVRRRLTDDDLQVLAQDGLRYRVDNALHGERSARYDPAAPLRVTYESTPGADPASTVPLLVAVRYCVRDETVKSLLHFTVDDAQYVAADARAKASGWWAVAAFMDHVIEALTFHAAACVQNLPPDVQAMLAEKWPRQTKVASSNVK